MRPRLTLRSTHGEALSSNLGANFVKAITRPQHILELQQISCLRLVDIVYKSELINEFRPRRSCRRRKTFWRTGHVKKIVEGADDNLRPAG